MEVTRVGDEFLRAVAEDDTFAVDIDGDIVPLMSLAPGVFDKIQRDYGMLWTVVLDSPVSSLPVAEALAMAAASKVGKMVGPFNDVASLVSLFVKVPSDLPDLPKVQGGTSENPTDAS